MGVILYAQALYEYDPTGHYNGAIIGWTPETLKGNVVDVIEGFLNNMGMIKDKDYELKYGSGSEKYLKIWNLKIYFFGFSNYLSFNKILGRPLILEWVDESARIYSQQQLQSTFNQLPGRQVSFAGHPFLKTIHSFNVEGSENHPYKLDILNKKREARHLTFYPYDNPKLDTKEKIRKVVEMFAPGTLRQQKIYNEWVVAEGRVFNQVNKLESLAGLQIREIGLGDDYGSVNPTTFVPIALCYNPKTRTWVLVRLQCYYHNPAELGTNPTTEFYSNQLRFFMVYLKTLYPHVPITTNVIDSEATHFGNRLEADNIPFETSKKGAGSVDEGVQHLQSLMYKDLFYVYEAPSVQMFYGDGSIKLGGKDDSLLEFESYQYDTIKSVKEGKNIYKKDLDHSIDATRYLIAEWAETGRCPIV